MGILILDGKNVSIQAVAKIQTTRFVTWLLPLKRNTKMSAFLNLFKYLFDWHSAMHAWKVVIALICEAVRFQNVFMNILW